MKRKTDKLMKMYDKKLKQLYKKCVANKFNQDIMAEFLYVD